MDLSDLTESQQSALQQFTSVTDQTHEDAIPLLQRCQWNVQIAIARFFDGEPSHADEETTFPPPQQNRRQEVLMNGFSASPTPDRLSAEFEAAPRIVPQPDGHQRTRQAPLIMSLIFAPINILYSLTSRIFHIFARLFPFLPSLLRRLSGQASTRNSSSHPNGRRLLGSRDTAARFIREFEEEYGSDRPPFFEDGYAQAYDAAKRDLKYLLIVLLSPENDLTDGFVRGTLLSSDFIEFVRSHNEELLIWAGNVQDPEAFQVSAELNCTKFPFSALIVHTPSQSSTAMSTVLRISGPTVASSYVSKLSAAMVQHNADLGRARGARAEQQASRTLRDQQNSAYERSLAQDRERTRQRREAEEAQRRAEQEAKVRIDAETREEENREQWRRWRATNVADEPTGDTKDVVRVSIRRPDGQRLLRKFLPDARMEELYAFVECADLLNVSSKGDETEAPDGWTHRYSFKLVSPMPRQVFDPESTGTLREQIGRSSNLIVEPDEPAQDSD